MLPRVDETKPYSGLMVLSAKRLDRLDPSLAAARKGSIVCNYACSKSLTKLAETRGMLSQDTTAHS